MKNLISFLFALLIVGFPSSSFAQVDFTDVDSPLLKEALYPLVRDNIIRGYPDLTFRPDQEISRAEALKLVFRVGDRFRLASHLRTDFDDVSSSDWFYPYISTAQAENLVQGYEDGTFRPHEEVNRVEFVKMAVGNLSGFYFMKDSSSLLQQYQDLEIDAWYLPFLSFAFTNTFLDETSTFRPTDPMTRGEAALIMSRIMDYRFLLEQEEDQKEWELAKKHGHLACDTCAGGQELKDKDWYAHPLIMVAYGELYIDGVKMTSRLNPYCEGCIQKRLRRAEWRHLPLEEKLQIDQQHPELYRRATGMTGGIRQQGKYLENFREAEYILNADGIPLRETDAEFENFVIRHFNERAIPVFYEDWIHTDAGKVFLSEIIDLWMERISSAK